MNYQQAARKTMVERVYATYIAPDSPFFPQALPEEGEGNRDGIWWVRLTTRAGMAPPRTDTFSFRSGSAANDFVERHPVGSEILDDPRWGGAAERRLRIISRMIDGESSSLSLKAGDATLHLAAKVLLEADVLHEREYSGCTRWDTSDEVLDFLGKDRIADLKIKFGDLWEIAAQFQYCWMNFSYSSPAYIAASCRYHYYVTHDEFSAGYLLRDLECLDDGSEAVASKAFEMRKNAGIQGRQASQKARKRRIEGLLTGMEVMAERNPDIAALDPTCLVALGLKHAAEVEPGLWTQGRGQVGEYLGEMRRGEAGDAVKTRFEALFSGEPPKRLQGGGESA